MAEQYLLYSNEFHTIICRECQYGIVKGNIQRHFRRFHKNIELHIRRQFMDYVKNLEIWDQNDIQIPNEEIVAVGSLKVYQGFICTVENCGHLRTTLTSIQQHCWEKHFWTEQKGNLFLTIIH